MNGYDIRFYRFKTQPDKQFNYTLEMEERLAAQWLGYTWQDYLALPGSDKWVDPDEPGDSKCAVLATYRLSKLMEAVAMDAKK